MCTLLAFQMKILQYFMHRFVMHICIQSQVLSITKNIFTGNKTFESLLHLVNLLVAYIFTLRISDSFRKCNHRVGKYEYFFFFQRLIFTLAILNYCKKHDHQCYFIKKHTVPGHFQILGILFQ